MDSQLVINQLNGEWKIKKDELKSIYHEIEESIKNASVQVEFRWIEREKNKEADRLSNVAMDKK
jgi:ribonuclease HI